MRRWAALVIIWGLGAVSGSMVGWTSALFTSTTTNPGNSFAAATSFCPSPSTQTMQTDKDTYIREDSAAGNFGAANDLWVQSRDTRDRRTLVSFPLPAKPGGCVLSSAVLRLYATTVSPSRTIQAYRVGESWTETGVTWTPQPATAGSPTTSPSGSTTGWKEWNVTTQVTEMYSSGINNGLLLKDQTESAGSQEEQVYQSREGGTNDPVLVVTFSDAVCSGPGTETVLIDRDSYIDEANPNTNYGTNTTLSVQSQSGSQDRRSLIYFPFPAIPTDCNLTEATLRLNASSADPGRTIGAYQAAASPSWTETGLTWNNRPFTSGTAATTSSGTGWREWDVTAKVSAMYSGTNNGFIVRDQFEGAGSAQTQTYSSREGGSDPELVLRFG